MRTVSCLNPFYGSLSTYTDTSLPNHRVLIRFTNDFSCMRMYELLGLSSTQVGFSESSISNMLFFMMKATEACISPAGEATTKHEELKAWLMVLRYLCFCTFGCTAWTISVWLIGSIGQALKWAAERYRRSGAGSHLGCWQATRRRWREEGSNHDLQWHTDGIIVSRGGFFNAICCDGSRWHCSVCCEIKISATLKHPHWCCHVIVGPPSISDWRKQKGR